MILVFITVGYYWNGLKAVNRWWEEVRYTFKVIKECWCWSLHGCIIIKSSHNTFSLCLSWVDLCVDLGVEV